MSGRKRGSESVYGIPIQDFVIVDSIGGTGISLGDETCKPDGRWSVVEGENVTAVGEANHAEGTFTDTAGFSAHAEGDNAVALGDWSHAEGHGTIAAGHISHAENYGCVTGYTPQAFTLDPDTLLVTISGVDATAEFINLDDFIILADKIDSNQAAGYRTMRTGRIASVPVFASGDTTFTVQTTPDGAPPLPTSGSIVDISISIGAHAEGEDTQAIGEYSHTSGSETIAKSDRQTVVGQCNVPVGTPGTLLSTDEIFTVGKGADSDHRANAFMVTRGGKGYIDDLDSISTALTLGAVNANQVNIGKSTGTVTLNGSVTGNVIACKIYTASISQSGTSDPTVVVRQNTLGGTVVWTRSNIGIYTATLVGAFPNTPLVYFISTSRVDTWCRLIRNDSDSVQLTTQVTSADIVTGAISGTNTDGILTDAVIEIRQY